MSQILKVFGGSAVNNVPYPFVSSTPENLLDFSSPSPSATILLSSLSLPLDRPQIYSLTDIFQRDSL